MNDQPTESTDDQVQPLCADVQARLDAHLDAIDRILDQHGEDRSARRAITDEIESQIREQLAQRAAANTPTVADVDALLAEMDPPEAYGEPNAQAPANAATGDGGGRRRVAAFEKPRGQVGLTQAHEQAVERSVEAMSNFLGVEPQYSGHAVMGFIVGLFGPPLMLYVAWAFLSGSVSVAFFIFSSLICALAMTVLGIIALDRIRVSQGRLYGKWLAIFDILFWPILLLWWICPFFPFF